jgi:hypothetical protein
MKQTFFLSILIPLALICSCQRQDSTAEAQLAQRKTELDVREEAIVQREKAVEQREKAVTEREKAVAGGRIIQRRRPAPDAAQAEAERQKRIQQLPPELRALIPDRSRIDAATAQKDKAAQKRDVESHHAPEQSQSNKQRKFQAMQNWQVSGGAGSSAVQTGSPTPSPATETATEAGSETDSPAPR